MYQNTTTMKKLLLLVIVNLFHNLINAQILCVQCYNQNDSVYAGTTNLILNGGFEDTTHISTPTIYNSFCPNSVYYNCNISNWLCTGGDTNTYARIWNDTFSYIPQGTKAAYFGNGWANSCSGDSTSFSFYTACLINSGCIVTGIPVGYPYSQTGYGGGNGVSLSQTVSGLTPGNTYVLEFWAGGEHGFTYSGIFAIDLGFGKTFLSDNPTPSFIGIGKRYLIVFNATSASHTIKFTNWGHIRGSVTELTTELILDDVKLYSLGSETSICGAVGINDQKENAISVYPNPITSELTVNTGTYEPSEIILYDITSRKVMQQTFTNTTTLNTEQLANGMYLYEVRNKNGVIKNGKVVKQ